MIDRITLKNAEDYVLDLNQADNCKTPLFDQLELWLDQHYGVRIVRDGQLTMVSFREAETWSTPIAARDLHREVSRAKRATARAARRPKQH